MTAWGVDGCKGGWIFVALGDGPATVGVARRFIELVELTRAGDPIFVDIPIGLPGPKRRPGLRRGG